MSIRTPTDRFFCGLERARSLSPAKDSQTAASSPALILSHSRSNTKMLDDPPIKVALSPQPSSPQRSIRSESIDINTNDKTPRPLPISPAKSFAPSNTNIPALSRASTLSWQQRPSSRDSSSPRSRPVSRHTDDLASVASDATDERRTRDQIAQSLGSKDPSWFRQTAERGLGSAAYRKTREDSHEESGFGSRHLLGMSSESSIEPEKAPYSAIPPERSRSPSQASSAQETNSWSNRYSGTSSHSTLGGFKSPLPTASFQRLDPPSESLDDGHGSNITKLVTSQTQAQQLRERPSSPTKGLGGFVQSAMMKRSDSVNKRWSAQAAPGLSRGNSLASHRGGLGYPASTAVGSGSPPRQLESLSHELGSSPSAKSRPTSSNSTSTTVHNVPAVSHAVLQANKAPETFGESQEQNVAKHSLLSSDALQEQEPKAGPRSFASSDTLPVSPTKTMDPKRWSPTKASWLESALARPESPKLTSPKPQTPSWMADLQKSKLSRDDSDSVKSPAPSFNVVSPTGLMRSPPPGGHARPLSIGGLPEGFSSGLSRKASPDKSCTPIFEESVVAEQITTKRVDQPEIIEKSPSTDSSGLATGALEDEPILQSAGLLSVVEEKKQPPTLKPKPQTPPKTDFRANLKPRQKTAEEAASKEPEFKNVFGKLRRTETKNYVAPDELKDNILRGKAALSLTEGPQKTKRVDEFKESILKKKESMKAGEGRPERLQRETSPTEQAPQKPSTVPEALAKRNALNKRGGSSTGQVPLKPTIASLGTIGRFPLNTGDDSAMQTETQSYLRHDPVPPPTTSAKPVPNPRSSIFGERESPRKVEVQGNTHQPDPTASTPAPESVQAAIDDTKSKGDKPASKLASRINPGLASILSREPPSAPGSTNASSEDMSSVVQDRTRTTTQQQEERTNGQLTHMTKARAKGPKRRLPNTSSSSDKPDEPRSNAHVAGNNRELPKQLSTKESGRYSVLEDVHSTSKSSTSRPHPRALAAILNNNNRITTPTTMNEQLVPYDVVDEATRKQEMEPASKPEGKEKARPAVAVKSPVLRKVSSPPIAAKPAEAKKLEQKLAVPTKPESSNLKPHVRSKQEIKIPQDEDVSSHGGTEPFKGSLAGVPSSLSKSTSATRQDFPDRQSGVELKSKLKPGPKSALKGLGLELESAKVYPSNSELTPPPESDFKKAFSPPLPAVKIENKDVSTPLKPVQHEQARSGAGDLLADFFDEKPRIADKAEVDAHALISNRPDVESRGKTLKTQVWEINADGKKQDLPPQQEHILFEDCMYLCVHSFESPAGSNVTEVYLWSGDRVGEAAVEDAQLFCRKMARENSTKLELLRQGKEPSKFFQALGGIVITRRSRSSALYMLCGRRHIGHIAFDEVDFDAASLCSGFPYIISAKFGKLYLWRGKGSSADEVGCARLIGMDLGLTGEIEEVEEGDEPPSFFESVNGALNPENLSQHWTLRPKSDRYNCRLFRVELEQSKGMSGFWTRRGSSPAKASKASVQEVYPICQRDLDNRSIYVLDSYFKVFV
jgi:Domain of unknown function (DUF4045)